jgi:uncharacterized cysteine cluster protein YcgN (CxxCxxCC family)
MTAPFWKEKTLSEMTPAEWESLCDGCGQCCLHKLEDADTGELLITEVACRLLDVQTCRCRHYAERLRYVPDCIHLTAAKIHEFHWLPPTCAYRLLAEGRDLPDWHPLITGTAESVHRAGISVQSWAISEREAGPLEDHVVAVVAGR